jgi:putative transposase
MPQTYHSSAHSKWNCICHLVFIPKYRRKALFGQIRAELKPIFHELAQQKGCRIVEGHMKPDHVHMCIEIPPKLAVSSVIGFLKGKSAIEIAHRFGGRQRNFTGEQFWARGYAASTVGLEVETVRAYIRDRACISCADVLRGSV